MWSFVRGLANNSRRFGSVAGLGGGGSGGGGGGGGCLRVTLTAMASPGTRYQSVANEGFHWRRMMSSSTAVAEEQGMKNVENQGKEKEKEKEKENALVSSYWGIYRPRITREDGSEWPWNCFMV